MRNKSLFLVLPVLFILSVGAQEPTEPMPVEQEKQAAPELAPAEQKAQETPEITPAQPAPGQQEPKEMEITSIKKEESPVKEEGTNMKSVNIGLPEATLKSSIEMLKKLQADEYVLYTKTLKFHWNVTQNLNFKALHAFFLEQYEQLLTFTDDVAERIRALGGEAPGTQTEFLKLTRLKEEPGVVPSAQDMIKKLLDDHEAIIRSIREDISATAKIDDMGTNNFLSDLITKHEKTAWMLRASVEK